LSDESKEEIGPLCSTINQHDSLKLRAVEGDHQPRETTPASKVDQLAIIL
jgi:hypothetical protein